MDNPNQGSLDTFQSTPLREGRHRFGDRFFCQLCFNPRPCVRGDFPLLEVTEVERFQSTPLREGRLKALVPVDEFNRFQSTPLREGRPSMQEMATAFDVFQSTPLREGRPKSPKR